MRQQARVAMSMEVPASCATHLAFTACMLSADDYSAGCFTEPAKLMHFILDQAIYNPGIDLEDKKELRAVLWASLKNLEEHIERTAEML